MIQKTVNELVSIIFEKCDNELHNILDIKYYNSYSSLECFEAFLTSQLVKFFLLIRQSYASKHL